MKRNKHPSFEVMYGRMIKTEKEIQLLKRSAKITDSCIPIIEKALKKEGVTEKQLARKIDQHIRRRGAQTSFPTIAVSGKRAIYIHGKPTDARLRGLGYTDFGAKYKGYHTDITVPFVKGDITAQQKRIIDTTLAAYDMAVRSIRLGQSCYILQEKFEAFLKKRKYDTRHSLGHGLGLYIHELPSITKPNPKKKLTKKKADLWNKIRKLRFQPGMVFTIEPGVYVKGIGGCRLENDFLMTNKGPQVLTNSRPLRF